METASARQQGFLEIDRSFGQFLEGLETTLLSFKQQRTELYVHLKERLSGQFQEWTQLLESYRVFLAGLPKEIRRRDFFGNLTKEIDHCEAVVRDYFGSLGQGHKNAVEACQSFLDQLKQQATCLTQRYETLQVHPLIRAFLEGKKILASRKNLQWGRKLFHVLNGLFGFWLYGFSGAGRMGAVSVLAGFLSVACLIEIGRRLYPRFNEWLCCRLSGIMREREKVKISSATWYMFSILVVFLLCPRDVALLVLLFVALGDTAAGIVGSLWGRHKFSSHASWEGLGAGFVVCLASTMLFLVWGADQIDLSGWNFLIFSVGAASVGACSETLFKRLDDNLVIPLVSAPALMLMVRLI